MTNHLTKATLAERVRAIIAAEPSVATMIERLLRQASEVYLYGGTTRDIGLGKAVSEINDFDMTIRCDSLEAVSNSLADLGIVTPGPFKYFKLHSHSGIKFDVSSISEYRNGVWPIKTIDDLLSTVDISVNAVAYDCLHDCIVDPTNGTLDIAHRILRAQLLERPDEPVFDTCTIPYPAILWFRYQSMAIKYSLTIEPSTLRWLKANQHYRAHQAEFSTLFWPPRLMDFSTMDCT